ncbi:unnamed protein product, partial [Rodentolepis nana]|uniref:Uncharacterized protein n=1 Tax=Rodentolepis nana TaxID=102285 RepID=A0A0R3TE01_RODNA
MVQIGWTPNQVGLLRLDTESGGSSPFPPLNTESGGSSPFPPVYQYLWLSVLVFRAGSESGFTIRSSPFPHVGYIGGMLVECIPGGSSPFPPLDTESGYIGGMWVECILPRYMEGMWVECIIPICEARSCPVRSLNSAMASVLGQSAMSEGDT